MLVPLSLMVSSKYFTCYLFLCYVENDPISIYGDILGGGWVGGVGDELYFWIFILYYDHVMVVE